MYPGNGGDLVTICWKENGVWSIQQTTEYGGNERWNYGIDPRQAHDYQSTVMPPAASECEEPVTSTAQVAPAHLPAVGGSDWPVMFALVIATLIGVHQWKRQKSGS